MQNLLLGGTFSESKNALNEQENAKKVKSTTAINILDKECAILLPQGRLRALPVSNKDCQTVQDCQTIQVPKIGPKQVCVNKQICG